MNLHNSSRVASPTIKSRCNELFACDVSNSYVLFSVMGIAHSIRSHCQSGCWLPGPCKCVATGKLRPRDTRWPLLFYHKRVIRHALPKRLWLYEKQSFLNTGNIFYFIPRDNFFPEKNKKKVRRKISKFHQIFNYI